MIKLPGLIDVHVHLRDPGQTYKEDFNTGTNAALAGGFAYLLDMPNNKEPVTTLKRLRRKITTAKKKARCFVGFYAGSLGRNLNELMKMEPYVYGLKLYLNRTTGNYLITEEKLGQIFDAWKSKKPILFHAESDIIEKVIGRAKQMKKRIHICHVSSIHELKTVIKAKKMGVKVTCGVTPHHLFLSENEVKKLGAFGLMKPEIQKGFKEFVWRNLKYVDVIESDHAPHTVIEKRSAINPPFGVPNLETTLPLLLTAVSEKKLTLKRLKELCYENPKKIFGIKTDKDTYIEIDEKIEYIIDNKNLKTKCGWSPYSGWKVKGKVRSVYIKGNKVF
jgi:carbamoyl-phosphate synthase/aspartate carbamoyltransferase/dihydroorotase